VVPLGRCAKISRVSAANSTWHSTPTLIAGSLPVGLRQRLEIMKALRSGADILILDEPTAVLTPQESKRLFAVLRRLAGEGRTVLLVTHKLKEVLAVTDRVSAMRAGRIVATVDTAATDAESLAELMIGRRLPPRDLPKAAPPGARCWRSRRWPPRSCTTSAFPSERARSSGSPGWPEMANPSSWQRLPA